MTAHVTVIVAGLTAATAVLVWITKLRWSKRRRRRTEEGSIVTLTLAPSTLLRGALFALEQCSRLLEDAVILFEDSRYSTAAGLALLAREEMGRHVILLDRWRKSAHGETMTVAAVTAACDDHVTKQRHAQSSLTYRADKDSQMGRLLEARHGHAPGTPEHKAADAQLRYRDKRRWKEQPHERHQKRMSAFYVDLVSDGSSWSRPCELNPKDCLYTVTAALNDYSQARERLQQAEPLYDDRELATAIAALPDAPDLPTPRRLSSEIIAAVL